MMFVLMRVNICDFGKLFIRSTTNVFMVVFDEQVIHVKQNTNMFNLFSLLKSRL